MQNAREHVISFDKLLVEAEYTRQMIDYKNVCKYGIDILDGYLGGILPNELVVVGADTGAGKSEIAYKIAITNAKRGKKVLLFSLEGDLHEVALRYIQRTISQLDPVRTIDYRFNLNKHHADYAGKIIEALDTESRVKNLMIFKKTTIPTMATLGAMIKQMQNDVDMIIIDHLHYLQFPTASQEIEEIGKVMREIKQITDTIRKPIILMSHLRKRKKDQDPTEQDLYGSSNIAKEANTIILLARMEAYNTEHISDKMIPGKTEKVDLSRYSGTKIIVEKSRTGLPVPSKFNIVYDLWKKDYVPGSGNIIVDESKASKTDFNPAFTNG